MNGAEGTVVARNGLWIVELVMLIWGSVVVFGTWANWTDDYYDRFGLSSHEYSLHIKSSYSSH